MNKKFIKSLTAGILGLGLIASCSMLKKEHHKCAGEKCHNKCSSKKVGDMNKCSADMKAKEATKAKVKK